MNIDKIKEYIANPRNILYWLDLKRVITLEDKEYLKILYRKVFKKELDLNNPQTFNEKLQWLKLNDRKDVYTTMVDKYEVKKYVSDIIGKEYIIPTLGIYDNFDEIDFNKLPNQFVIKCTHDSGGVVICKNKEKLDIKEAKRKIDKSLKNNYYYSGREWPYKNVKPRIIIDEYIEDKIRHELVDYKIYAFNGKCDYVMACFDRFNGGPKFIYFDRDWNIKKEFSSDGLKYGNNIELTKPKNLDKMFESAEKLSKGIPFVRVDFYEANGKMYFGELTFYPSSGFDNTRTPEIKEYLNKKLKIKGEDYEKNRIFNQ